MADDQHAGAAHRSAELTEFAPRRRAVLLYNATARRAHAVRMHDHVRELLAPSFDLRSEAPRSAGAMEEASRRAADEGVDVVIAAGGDGTVNVVANGLAGTETAMGVLPLGTANDLSRELGIPRDLERAVRRVADGSTRTIDIVTINGRGFCTVAGLGLIARTSRANARLKGAHATRAIAELAGAGIYRIITTAELLSPDPLLTEVEIDLVDPQGESRRVTGVVHALFVTNHRTLGGGLRLPVAGSGDDGLFEIGLVRRRPRLSLMMNFARLSWGRTVPEGVLEIHRAKSARITTGAAEAFVADGETLAHGTNFEVAIRPRALRVIA